MKMVLHQWMLLQLNLAKISLLDSTFSVYHVRREATNYSSQVQLHAMGLVVEDKQQEISNLMNIIFLTIVSLVLTAIEICFIDTMF